MTQPLHIQLRKVDGQWKWVALDMDVTIKSGVATRWKDARAAAYRVLGKYRAALQHRSPGQKLS